MQTANDWGSAVVVDPRMLVELRDSNTSLSTSLSRTRTVLKVCVAALVAGCAFSATVSYRQANHISRQASHITNLSAQVQKYRRSADRSDVALGALARSHESILAATAKAPSIGSDSWGHRFIVTQYTARSPLYGKDNDGFTSTMWKADPNARIVAVDPKLIPLGTKLHVPGYGPGLAADVGYAIRGKVIDLWFPSMAKARQWGRRTVTITVYR